MASSHLLSVGEIISFGRGRGQKTKAEIIRINTTTCTVRTLEARGKRAAGTEWRVPFSLISKTTTTKVDREAVKVAEARKAAEAKRGFDQWAASYGLKPEWFGQTFTSRGTDYRITGINLRAPKFPINAERVSDGKSFKFTSQAVQRGMTR